MRKKTAFPFPAKGVFSNNVTPDYTKKKNIKPKSRNKATYSNCLMMMPMFLPTKELWTGYTGQASLRGLFPARRNSEPEQRSEPYGGDPSVSELIPHILETFLKSDPAFAKAQKKVADVEEQATQAKLFRTGKSAATANIPSTSQTKGA